MSQKKVTSDKWKEFGPDTWLVELIQYSSMIWGSTTGDRKHGFVHFPCPKGSYKAFGEGYGLYEGDTCEECGNVLPKVARESEGYLKLMNAVQKYGTTG